MAVVLHVMVNLLFVAFGIAVLSLYDAAAINLSVGDSAQQVQTFIEMLRNLNEKEWKDFNTKATEYNYAVCDFVNNADLDSDTAAKNDIVGKAVLKEEKSGTGPLYVSITLTGIDTSSPVDHGFHVHEFGDLSDGCTSTGSHFNPAGKNHGAPDAAERHVGDWGNVVRDSSGKVDVLFEDNLATMASGEDNNIIGRGLVLHALTDDLGLGGNPESLITGNAGARLACCIIARSAAPSI